jgi:hypothetical protein
MTAQTVYESFALGDEQIADGVHLEPLARKYIASFLAVTNLDWAALGTMSFGDALQAAHLYIQPTETIEGTDLWILLESFSREGRDVLSGTEMKAITGDIAATAVQEASCGRRESACVTVAEVRDNLIEHLTNSSWPANRKEKWIGWLKKPLEEFRRKELSKVYLAAFIGRSFPDFCNKYFRRYIWSALSTNRPQASTSSIPSAVKRDDFLKRIEQKVPGLPSGARSIFRREVLASIMQYMNEHDCYEPEYNVHKGLGQGIEAFVRSEVIGVARYSDAFFRPTEYEPRLRLLREVLIEGHGYCKHCSGKLVTEVFEDYRFLC